MKEAEIFLVSDRIAFTFEQQSGLFNIIASFHCQGG